MYVHGENGNKNRVLQGIQKGEVRLSDIMTNNPRSLNQNECKNTIYNIRNGNAIQQDCIYILFNSCVVCVLSQQKKQKGQLCKHIISMRLRHVGVTVFISAANIRPFEWNRGQSARLWEAIDGGG